MKVQLVTLPSIHSPVKSSAEVRELTPISATHSRLLILRPTVMASKTLIFFDLETTGLQTDVCNIIQVSAICEGRAFNGYAVPELPLSEHVRNLTGFAVDGPYLYRHGVVMQTLLVKDLLRRFIDYLSQFYCPLLVAHNAERFDAPVIMRVMAENGLLQRFRQVVSGFVDTFQLIKRLNPCLPGYSLTALVRQFLGQRFDAHNALEDAKILEKLFITWRPSKHHVDMCTSSI